MAEPVTKQQATATASKFFSSHGAVLDRKVPVMMAPSTGGTTTTSAYYVFNAKDNKGFAIVSGDDRTPAILGYSTTGSFDLDNAPDNVRYWLGEYARQIEYIQENNIKPVETRASGIADNAKIAHMVQTTWNQGVPYYNGCPTVNGIKAATGCVATAMAQILYYQYQQHPTLVPSTLQAEIPSYSYQLQYDESVTSTIEGTAAGATIDWANMKLSYSSGDTEAPAISDFMLYCGKSVEMKYAYMSSGESGAPSINVANAVHKYFGMSSKARYVAHNNYTNADWNELIYTELQNGRPVFYAGYNSSAGHAFVINGYEGDYYFDVNWGWGGSCNGAFLLSALTPETTGIGGGESDNGYNTGQEAVIGIEAGTATDDGFHLTAASFNIDSTSNSYPFAYYWPMNGGSAEESYDYGFGIIGDNGAITQVGTTHTATIAAAKYSDDYAWITPYQFESYGTGTYKVVPIGKLTTASEWQSLFSAGKYINVNIGTDKSTMTTPPAISISNFATAGTPMSGDSTEISFDITANDLYFGTLDIYYVIYGYESLMASIDTLKLEKGDTKHFAFKVVLSSSPSYQTSTFSIKDHETDQEICRKSVWVATNSIYVSDASAETRNPESTVQYTIVNETATKFDGKMYLETRDTHLDKVVDYRTIDFSDAELTIESLGTKTITANIPITKPGEYSTKLMYQKNPSDTELTTLSTQGLGYQNSLNVSSYKWDRKTPESTFTMTVQNVGEFTFADTLKISLKAPGDGTPHDNYSEIYSIRIDTLNIAPNDTRTLTVKLPTTEQVDYNVRVEYYNCYDFAYSSNWAGGASFEIRYDLSDSDCKYTKDMPASNFTLWFKNYTEAVFDQPVYVTLYDNTDEENPTVIKEVTINTLNLAQNEEQSVNVSLPTEKPGKYKVTVEYNEYKSGTKAERKNIRTIIFEIIARYNTDLTDGGGTFTYSSDLQVSGSNTIDKAFDNDPETMFGAIPGTTEEGGYDGKAWIQYEAPAPITVGSYALSSGSGLDAAPSAWTIQGSNDGTNWTTLDERSDETFSSTYEQKAYDIPTEKVQPYKYFRLNMLKFYNPAVWAFLIQEWQLFEGSTDGIGDILSVGGNGRTAVYNLNGMYMGTTSGDKIGTFLQSLPKGIYIVNGKKVAN